MPPTTPISKDPRYAPIVGGGDASSGLLLTPKEFADYDDSEPDWLEERVSELGREQAGLSAPDRFQTSVTVSCRTSDLRSPNVIRITSDTQCQAGCTVHVTV